MNASATAVPPIISATTNWRHAALSAAERERIVALANDVATDLAEWSRRYPLIRPVRCLPLALSVAASAPFCSRSDIFSTARVSLWVFAVDDAFDEGGWSRRVLVRRANEYRAICRGGRATLGQDELAYALSEIVDDMARFPVFQPLSSTWAGAIEGTLDGMLREDNWRHDFRRFGRPALPTYREYMTAGRYSIGGPPHIWSSVITAGDLSVSRCFELIRSMERTASQCIRLANDLRSDEKEKLEGKVNGIRILTTAFQDVGLPAADAHDKALRRIASEIDRGLLRLERFVNHSATDTGRPEAAIANIARFVCDFYSKHDYHTFVASGGQFPNAPPDGIEAPGVPAWSAT